MNLIETHWTRMSDTERLLSQIEPEPTSGCWLWTGLLDSNGYGKTSAKGRRITTRLAHRIVYQVIGGLTISDDLTLDHLCRVRCCVNPAHLEPVPLRDNILRGASPIARAALSAQCQRGHLLSGDNLTPGSTPRRRKCRQCIRIRDAARVRTRSKPRAVA